MNDETYQKSKIYYGLPRNSSSLVHISKVQNGLKCNCICPCCKQPLIAKNDGEIRDHHFAHYYSDRECKFVHQTILHILAKEILSEGGSIYLPQLQFADDTVFEGETIKPTKVFLEKRFSNFVPDVIVEYNDKKLIVEIFVTNKVSKEKLKKIEQSNVSALEINLSSTRRDITKEELSKILLSGKNTSWIYNRIKAQKEIEKQREKEKQKLQLRKKDGGVPKEYRVYGGGIHSRDLVRIINPPCNFDRKKNWAGYYKVVNSDVNPCEKCSFFVEYKYKGNYKYLVCCKR